MRSRCVLHQNNRHSSQLFKSKRYCIDAPISGWKLRMTALIPPRLPSSPSSLNELLQEPARAYFALLAEPLSNTIPTIKTLLSVRVPLGNSSGVQKARGCAHKRKSELGILGITVHYYHGVGTKSLNFNQNCDVLFSVFRSDFCCLTYTFFTVPHSISNKSEAWINMFITFFFILKGANSFLGNA